MASSPRPVHPKLWIHPDPSSQLDRPELCCCSSLPPPLLEGIWAQWEWWGTTDLCGTVLWKESRKWMYTPGDSKETDGTGHINKCFPWRKTHITHRTDPNPFSKMEYTYKSKGHPTLFTLRVKSEMFLVRFALHCSIGAHTLVSSLPILIKTAGPRLPLPQPKGSRNTASDRRLGFVCLAYGNRKLAFQPIPASPYSRNGYRFDDVYCYVETRLIESMSRTNFVGTDYRTPDFRCFTCSALRTDGRCIEWSIFNFWVPPQFCGMVWLILPL